MPLPSDLPRKLRRALPPFGAALMLGAAFGIAAHGLPLVGAFLAIAVLSLISALQGTKKPIRPY